MYIRISIDDSWLAPWLLQFFCYLLLETYSGDQPPIEPEAAATNKHSCKCRALKIVIIYLINNNNCPLHITVDKGRSETADKSGTGTRYQRRPCRYYNKGRCRYNAETCQYRHVCNVPGCQSPEHVTPECPDKGKCKSVVVIILVLLWIDAVLLQLDNFWCCRSNKEKGD